VIGEPFLFHIQIWNPHAKHVVKQGRATFSLDHGVLQLQVSTDGQTFHPLKYRDLLCRGPRANDHTVGTFTVRSHRVIHIWIWGTNLYARRLLRNPGVHHIRLAYEGKQVGASCDVELTKASSPAAQRLLKQLVFDATPPYSSLRKAIFDPQSVFSADAARRAAKELLLTVKNRELRETLTFYKNMIEVNELLKWGRLRISSPAMIEIEKRLSEDQFPFRAQIWSYLANQLKGHKDATLSARGEQAEGLLKKHYPDFITGSKKR